MARERCAAQRYGALAAQESGSVRATRRVVGRLKKPHGQQGEVAVIPLVENPGAIFGPRARLLILDADERVIAGPLIIARRRSYHRQWLLGFAGVTSRDVVDAWRDHYVAIDEPDVDG